MSKVKVKVKRPKVKKWVTKWCTEHAIDLAHYRGMVVTLHPEKGIVGSAKDVDVAIIQEQFLKRSVARECYHVNVDQVLAEIGRPGLRVIPRPDGPMDPHRQEAKEPVPEKVDPPPSLAPAIDPFDNDVTLDGSSDSDVGTFNPKPEDKATPFPSPDPQPKFMPRRSPLSDVRLDGVSNPGFRSSSGRGLRYD